MNHDEVSSAAGFFPAAGGAFPQAATGTSEVPSNQFECQYFVVVPLTQIKPYNREVVEGMIGRFIAGYLDVNARDCFPPPIDSWDTPFSFCIRFGCTPAKFEKIRKEIKNVFTTFGGTEDMLHYFQSTTAEKL